jgi:hypothetical protein
MQFDAKNIRYVDIPELPETFIDSFRTSFFDGTSFRIDLCATRIDELNPPNPPTARQYPVCRLVMPPQAMLAIFNNLQNLINTLIKEGVLKTEPPKPIIPEQKH